LLLRPRGADERRSDDLPSLPDGRARCLRQRGSSLAGQRILKVDKAGVLWSAERTVCPPCGQSVIRLVQHATNGSRLTEFMVWPRAYSRAPLAPSIPEHLAADYREACAVLVNSAKASAALSRRCLQHLLRQAADVKPSELSKEIDEVLASRSLPSQLAEAIDAIRNLGNFAAHPVKSRNTGEIVDVEPGEAEWLLNVLESLFDFYFVQPALLAAKRNALNKKLKESGKPPMK
jgi:hypothetical protein